MAEEAPVVNEEVEAPATPPESTPDEKQKSEVAEEDLILKGFKGETDTQDTEGNADETEEEQPQGKAEKRLQQVNDEITELEKQKSDKPDMNTTIREAVARRNALREEVGKVNSETYQAATDSELLGQTNPETGQGFTALEAKVESMRQNQELRDYTERVAESQLTLQTEAEQSLRDFPMFDQNNKAYSPDIATSVDSVLGANLIYDPNTRQVIGSHVSPYELYKSFAQVYQAAAATNQIKGQQAVTNMMANADVPGGTSPKTEKKDPFLEGLLGKA